jgi:hypothetical protein
MQKSLRLACLGIFAGAAPLAGVAAVAQSGALSQVTGGLWEVSRSAAGSGAVRQCIANPAALAQWEHRGRPCTRVILSDKGSEAIIHYTCPAGDFGRSSMTVITPRSLRIETQGIHGGEPFFYKLYARRVADC